MSGPQCCSNPPTLNPTSGSGHVEKLGGLDSYLTGSPDSKLAIVLVSDIFGYDAPNLRKLADKIAAAGFFAVVPDFFYGDPYVLAADGSRDSLPAWLKGHGADKGFEDVKVVIEALKSKGVCAIGAVGFCWGAKVVVELAKGDFIQAAVLAHPSFVTLDDIKAVKVPISILGAEIDRMSPPELVKQFEEALTAKSEIKSHVKIFPKVSHGWTVRYDVSDEEAVKPAEEAHKDMLDWFVNHVKMSGPACCSNPPALNPASGSGLVEKLAGLDSYVTGSPDSKLAILLIADIFGYEAPLLRKLADKIAAVGYFVVVPDFFYGDAFPGDAGPVGNSSALPIWLKIHIPIKACEAAKPLVEALKSRGVSAIGAVGFCWGAKAVVELAKYDNFLHAAVLCHPSFVTVDDCKAVKVPISILGAEIDPISPPDVVKQFEEVLTAKTEIKSHVKIFPKVQHGWTVRYNAEDEAAVKCAEEAHQDILDWLFSHLK
ncbi:hypothetical protein ACLB2K_040095 [Fragaria x ananassa]